MKSPLEIIEIAKRVLTVESQSIIRLMQFIDHDFSSIIEIILNIKGRVIITGVGKSAIIGQKIVATLNSTGTPAVFMHAADAIHGDLGIIQQGDLVICISNSGNTSEIKVLVPLLKQSNNTLVAMVGDVNSFLAQQADYVINTSIEQEACPHNLAPTSSTTAQLAMGDALSVCLLECRNFRSEDFAKFHPGGSLGKRLYLKVKDLSALNEKPMVSLTSDIRTVILEITKKRLGISAVVENNSVKGVVTDGDLRRMMEKYPTFEHLTAKDIMTGQPKTIGEDELAVLALKKMKDNNITQLIVTKGNVYSGVIHLHDLLREGII